GTVAGAAAGDGGVVGRGGIDDRADVDPNQTAEIALRRAAHRRGRARQPDLAAVHAHKSADDAVRAGAGDRAGRERQPYQAVEIDDADEPAQNAVAAAGARAARECAVDGAVVARREAAGEAVGADRDVAA